VAAAGAAAFSTRPSLAWAASPGKFGCVSAAHPLSERLRQFMAGLFLFGSAGMLAELALLDHTESLVQWLPFLAVGAGALAMAWALWRPGVTALRSIQATGVAIAVVGRLGVWYHYRGNTAFELEIVPTAGGWALAWESLTGATPALAPGLMIQLGLLGLAFTYRHPALRGRGSFGTTGDDS